MFSAFLDTNVLVPSGTRDILLETAERDVYRPLWSSEVLAEMDRTVRARRQRTEGITGQSSCSLPVCDTIRPDGVPILRRAARTLAS